jgi:hypothetical protein
VRGAPHICQRGVHANNKPDTINAASNLVRACWLYRITTEYVSGVYAQDHARRLTYVCASPDLIEAAFGVALDELHHSSLVAELCAEAGGPSAAPIDPALLALSNPDAVLTDLVVGTVQNFCIAETVATRAFRQVHPTTTVDAARAVLDVFVEDEPRHGALGWATLDWLLDSPWRDDVRRFIATELDGWIAMFDSAYTGTATYEVTANDRAWGLNDGRDTASTWRTTLTRDLKPRFAKRGFAIDAS